jgi:uroporphyrinogen-III synthase
MWIRVKPDAPVLRSGRAGSITAAVGAPNRLRTVAGMTDAPLSGYVVGVTAERRREELGAALERQGARVVYGPAIRVVPLADDTGLLAATRRCLAGPLDLAVATTGVGFRGWLSAAEGWGLAPELLARLGAATILTRGPKVRGAVRAAGLREQWSPESESSDEVLEHLVTTFDLAGRRVAIQLHGDPLRDFVDTLRAGGAEVIEVPVYRWEPPADVEPLHRLIDAVAGGGLDAVTFTSAPAATNFLRTADSLGVLAAVVAALGEPVLCAAVGPVTAAPLLAAGVPVVSPERFRLGALVRKVVEELPLRAPVAGR